MPPTHATTHQPIRVTWNNTHGLRVTSLVELGGHGSPPPSHLAKAPNTIKKSLREIYLIFHVSLKPKNAKGACQSANRPPKRPFTAFECFEEVEFMLNGNGPIAQFWNLLTVYFRNDENFCSNPTYYFTRARHNIHGCVPLTRYLN